MHFSYKTKYFCLRIGRYECLFFVYGKQYYYSVTWDNIYGFDCGKARM